MRSRSAPKRESPPAKRAPGGVATARAASERCQRARRLPCRRSLPLRAGGGGLRLRRRFAARRQVRVEEAQRVRRFDHAHPFPLLQALDLLVQGGHARPMRLWPEMMFGMVAVIEPDPVVEFVVA